MSYDSRPRTAKWLKIATRDTLFRYSIIARTQLDNHLISTWRKSDGVNYGVGDSKRRHDVLKLGVAPMVTSLS